MQPLAIRQRGDCILLIQRTAHFDTLTSLEKMMDFDCAASPNGITRRQVNKACVSSRS
jgi:hypothetical protein